MVVVEVKGKNKTKANRKRQKNHPIQLKGNELGKHKDIGESKKKATEYYKNHLQGKKVRNEGLEGEVMFSRKGVEKFVHTSRTENKLKMIVVLRDVIENGNYMGTTDSYKERNDGFVKFHRINHFVELTEGSTTQVYEVSSLIGKDKQGNKFYNLNDDVEKWRKKKRTHITSPQ